MTNFVKTSLFALTAISAVALATATQAQDRGARLEARVGYASASADASPDLEGAVYGLAGGYDFAIGQNLYAGIDAAVEWDSASAEETAGDVTTEIDLGQTLELGGRIGLTLNSGMSVYARAAYVTTDVEAAITVVGTTDTTRVEFNDDMDGVRLAIGGDHPLGERLRLTGELRHSIYDNIDQTGLTIGLATRF